MILCRNIGEMVSEYRGSQHSFHQGSVRAFELFAAEAKWAGFNIIKCVLRPGRKAKIIAYLSVCLTLLEKRVL